MRLRPRRDVDVTVISGLSGAGRSEAAKVLEDLGWFVIDNLPPALIDKMLSLALAPGNRIRQVAFVIDARGGAFFLEAANALDDLRRDVRNCRLVFLEASDDVLVRRYETHRRRHPLAEGERVIDGIKRERRLMQPFREIADLTLDTSELSVHDLRARLTAGFADVTTASELKTTVMSFGYKFGLPLDADMVLDLRFLPNPHWVEGLRELTGLDPPVYDYVMEQEATGEFLARLRDFMDVLLPAYQKDGRHYLTIALGCTGGRHRSVVIGEMMGEYLKERDYPVTVMHRDVERMPVTR